MALKDLKFVQIPVTKSYPSYTMKVSLDGQLYTLFFYYNIRLGIWLMDLQDQTGNELIASIAMLPDYPLNYRYADRIPGTPPGIFYVVDETGQNRTPDLTNFGVDVNLFYLQAN